MIEPPLVIIFTRLYKRQAVVWSFDKGKISDRLAILET